MLLAASTLLMNKQPLFFSLLMMIASISSGYSCVCVLMVCVLKGEK
jgi:hypothetical protein